MHLDINRCRDHCHLGSLPKREVEDGEGARVGHGFGVTVTTDAQGFSRCRSRSCRRQLTTRKQFAHEPRKSRRTVKNEVTRTPNLPSNKENDNELRVLVPQPAEISPSIPVLDLLTCCKDNRTFHEIYNFPISFRTLLDSLSVTHQ